MTIGGISHVSFDGERPRRGTRGSGWRSWDSHPIEQPAFAILAQPSAPISLPLLTHDDGADDTFDGRRVGLDHLPLDANRIDALRA
jgi:hypothetical protein